MPTTEAQLRASAKWTKNHPEYCRAKSARYYEKHTDKKRRTMIIYRIKQGLNVKPSTLEKYEITEDEILSLKEPHL